MTSKGSWKIALCSCYFWSFKWDHRCLSTEYSKNVNFTELMTKNFPKAQSSSSDLHLQSMGLTQWVYWIIRNTVYSHFLWILSPTKMDNKDWTRHSEAQSKNIFVDQQHFVAFSTQEQLLRGLWCTCQKSFRLWYWKFSIGPLGILKAT